MSLKKEDLSTCLGGSETPEKNIELLEGHLYRTATCESSLTIQVGEVQNGMYLNVFEASDDN